MGLPEHGTLFRGQGRDATVWDIEATYSDGSGTPVLDTNQSSQDTRVATPVADGGTGITSIKFPKCHRVWLAYGPMLEPATEGAASNYRQVSLVSVSPSAGTAEVRFVAADGSALSDPESGSRLRLGLRLEYS